MLVVKRIVTALLALSAMSGCGGSQSAESISPAVLAAREQAAMDAQTSFAFSVRWAYSSGPRHSHGVLAYRVQEPDRFEVAIVQYDGAARMDSYVIVIGDQLWGRWAVPHPSTRYQHSAGQTFPGKTFGHPPLARLLDSPFVTITTQSCGASRCYRVSTMHPIWHGGRLVGNAIGTRVGEVALIDVATYLPVREEMVAPPPVQKAVIDYSDYGVPNVIEPPPSDQVLPGSA